MIFGGAGEGIAIASGQQLWFVVITSVPYGARGMDNELSRQLESRGNDRLTGFASVEFPACFEQFFSCGAVNCSGGITRS